MIETAYKPMEIQPRDFKIESILGSDGSKFAPRWRWISRSRRFSAPNRPKTAPRAPKIGPRDAKTAPKGPLEALSSPKMAPRWRQDGVRWRQHEPSWLQHGAPNAKMAPRSLQNGHVGRSWAKWAHWRRQDRSKTVMLDEVGAKWARWRR